MNKLPAHGCRLYEQSASTVDPSNRVPPADLDKSSTAAIDVQFIVTAQMNVQTNAEHLPPVQGGKTCKLVFKEFPKPLRRGATVTGITHDAFVLRQ